MPALAAGKNPGVTFEAIACLSVPQIQPASDGKKVFAHPRLGVLIRSWESAIGNKKTQFWIAAWLTLPM